LLAVDRRMDVQKVTGQHVQRGVGWQLETEGLCVVSVRLDVCELVRRRCFSFDSGDGAHSSVSF
jgi:hypothetical protein